MVTLQALNEGRKAGARTFPSGGGLLVRPQKIKIKKLFKIFIQPQHLTFNECNVSDDFFQLLALPTVLSS
jgi:hypothetical protein